MELLQVIRVVIENKRKNQLCYAISVRNTVYYERIPVDFIMETTGPLTCNE